MCFYYHLARFLSCATVLHGALFLSGMLSCFGTRYTLGFLPKVGSLSKDGFLSSCGTLMLLVFLPKAGSLTINGLLSCFGTLHLNGFLTILGTLKRCVLLVLLWHAWHFCISFCLRLAINSVSFFLFLARYMLLYYLPA